MLHRSKLFGDRKNNHVTAIRYAGRAISLALIANLWLGHAPATAQTYPTQIGTEAGCRGAGEFVDLVKTVRPWGVIGGSTSTPIDANGWPTTDAEAVLMDDRPLPAWAPPIDDPAGIQPNESGVYNCSFTGQATLAVNGGSVITIANQVYNSGTNTTTFTFTLPTGTWQTAPNLVVIDFSNTKLTATSATNTGFTHFKAIRPGYPANTTQVFTDPFVNATAPFDHLRFMGWKDTNYSAGYYGDAGHHLINWSDRGLPSDASQATNQTFRAGAIGYAWEYIILLANQINKDVWINIPISATGYNTTDTTSYIYQLALLFKNGDAATGGVGLKPSLHIYIEHSNEVWNFGFSQYTWNKLEAVDAVAGTGSLGTTKVNSDGSTDQEVWAHRRHAERLYEIAQIFKTVFGTGSLNTTIRPVYASWVINGQSYYTDVLNWMNTQYGAPSGYFYAMAGTSYFNETPTAGESVATILANMTANSDSSLTYTKQLRTIATSFGLKLFAYEAGPDNGGGSTTNVGNRILANRDPGMTTLIEHDVRTNYFGQGLADSYNYFTMSSGFNRYGCWGASDDITVTNGVKWQAIYNLTGYNPGGPPSTPTGLTATAGNTQIVLNWSTATGATSYKIYRSTTTGGEGTTPIASGVTAITYTDTGLTNGTTYYYKIASANTSGTSAQSSEASATPSGTVTPPAPANLAATAGNAQVSLTWSASTGATSYSVYRGTSAGGESATAVASGIATTNYTNTGLVNGTKYYFKVKATNSAGTSGYSNEASATPSSVTIPPAPTNLTAAPGNAQVVLNWTASSGATSYTINFTTGGNYTVAGTTAGTTFTHTGLTNGTLYTYYVTATNTAGTSGASNNASATPSAGGGTGLKGEYYNSQDFSGPIALTRTDPTVDFNWNSGSPGTGVNATNFCVRWSGQVLAPVTGNYIFSTTSDDGVRLWVNGVRVINDWTLHGTTVDNSSAVALTAGTKYDIHMEYFQATGGDIAKLHWNYPGQADQAIPTTQLFPTEQIATIATATTAPVIDGTVDAVWGNTPTYSEPNLVGTLPTGATLATSWQAMWDSTNIYVLATVTDSTLIANTDPTLGDSVEVYIDGDNNKSTAYDANDWQYVFPWNGTTVEQWSGGHQGTNTTGVTFAQVNITGGYRIELKIPWTTIGVTPAANNLVGLDFAINDSNVLGAKACKIFWHATADNDWTNPSLFGTGKLK